MKKKAFFIITAILSLYAGAFMLSKIMHTPVKIKPFIAKLPAFTVIGHQGSPYKHPGNTIESFKETLSINPNAMLEMDVHLTKDGHVVVNHDRELQTTTSGTGNIDQLSLAEIQKLDAGYKISFDNGKTYPFRGKGYIIPTLESVLKTFPRTLMSIDIKNHTVACADAALQLIFAHRAADYVIIGSFSNTVMKHVRKKYPVIATSFSQSEVTKFFVLHKLHLTGFFRAKDDAMMIPEFSDSSKPEYLGPEAKQGFRIITKKFISDAAELNIPVMAWTINKKKNMQRLHNWKIRGIVTDYPKVLTEITKK